MTTIRVSCHHYFRQIRGDGDGLSTSCFALGLEKGMELINSLPDVQAVFITDDYELHYSEGFKDKIKIKAVEK